MDQTFTNRVAVVTGAASGIGQAVAVYLAERGARVVGVDRDDRIRAAMEALPGSGHHAIAADLTATDAASDVIREAVETAGGVHILVNSAGIALLAPALELTAADWQSTIDVNLSASFYMAQAAGRMMVPAEFGRIINLASQAAVIGLDQHVAYSASKAALLGMTHVLSLEWARSGVTINCISPTVVETPLAKIAWSGEKGEQMKALIPTGRFAQPHEIAALVGYLASDDAGMVTGENILIDGGYATV